MDFVFANPQDQGNVKTTGLRNLSGLSSEIWVRLSRKVGRTELVLRALPAISDIR
jgi:hypothetical protein